MKLKISLFDKGWWIVRKTWWNLEEKVSNSVKIGFDIDPVYIGKYSKSETISNNRKINTNFQGDKILNEGPQYICPWAILIDLA